METRQFKFTKNPVGNINAILNKAKKEWPQIRIERTKTEEKTYVSGTVGAKILWKIWFNPDHNTSTDIGYVFPHKNEGQYFFYNTNTNGNALNGVWNNKSKYGVGPEGWYTFDEAEIVEELKDAIKNLLR